MTRASVFMVCIVMGVLSLRHCERAVEYGSLIRTITDIAY